MHPLSPYRILLTHTHTHTHTNTQAPANHHTHGRDLRYCRRLRAQDDLQEACAHAKQLGVQVRRQRKESLTILKNHVLMVPASAVELLLEGMYIRTYMLRPN